MGGKEIAPAPLNLRGHETGGIYLGVSQGLIDPEAGLPRPFRLLQAVENLAEFNLKHELGLSGEFISDRVAYLSQEHLVIKAQKELSSLVVGIHGPLQVDFKEVLWTVSGGVPMPIKEKMVAFGAAVLVGTEKGIFSLFYGGEKIAKELGAYYNLHPGGIYRLALKGELGKYINQGVCLENGWVSSLKLTYNPKMIRAFLKHFPGLMLTLDTAHAAQVAEKRPDFDYEIYLRELWEIGPRIIHLSDKKIGGEGHYPLGRGDYGGVLKELIGSMRNSGAVVILEIDPKHHPDGQEGALLESLEFVDKNL